MFHIVRCSVEWCSELLVGILLEMSGDTASVSLLSSKHCAAQHIFVGVEQMEVWHENEWRSPMAVMHAEAELHGAPSTVDK